jgi:hypothetical protein
MDRVIADYEEIQEAYRCADSVLEAFIECRYEDGCPLDPRDTGDFICGDGEEIPGSWECDGFADCQDASDEQECDALDPCDSNGTSLAIDACLLPATDGPNANAYAQDASACQFGQVNTDAG